jgi:hypothetical protein
MKKFPHKHAFGTLKTSGYPMNKISKYRIRRWAKRIMKRCKFRDAVQED